jgi:phage terminase small subunit
MPARRTTNHLKELKGTDRPDRMRDEPEFPVVDDAPAPDWLIGPEAVAEWCAKVALLSAAGVLTEASLAVLGHYCNMHASAVKKWRAGMDPSAADLTQLRLMATEFGFTPASKSKAGGGGGAKTEGNPFRKLNAG